jgi:hypothetical protein
MYTCIHQLPKDIDHIKKYGIVHSYYPEKNKYGSTYFSSTFDVNETSALSHAID